MSLYTQHVDRKPGWLNGWLKVNESQKRELWIKSAVAEDNCELIYNETFCANARLNGINYRHVQAFRYDYL